MRGILRLQPLVLLFAFSAAAITTEHFESAHVHPVEMSPDGTRLFVVHTAGHELAVFDLTGPSGPVRIGKVPVGYEPVTVRARTNTEVWVVSHVSDAVSIVDINTMNVIRTLRPGDEPTDVAFAGNRAFVCVSQRDKIAAYDLTNLSAAPVDIPLLHSDPRSLAVSPDGSTLYVAALDSQNETSVVRWEDVLAGGGPPPPNPAMDPTLPPVPDEALIVRYDGTAWRDETGKDWGLPYTLYDHDVIEIDTGTLAVTGHHRGVGTSLFNMAVNPNTGLLYVTNQEAINEVRFEQNLKGRYTQARVTLVDPGTGTVTPVHLNSHINYANTLGDPVERSLSLGIPLDLDISSDGSTLYVAAMGSKKVGVLDAAGNVTRRIPVGDGPTGLALDEARNRLYVVNKFIATLSVVNLADDSSYQLPLGYDPSDPSILNGRKFLYDTEFSSSHGDNSCATCHLFGQMDGLAWDLGNPLGVVLPPKPTSPTPNAPPGVGYHPMKGPMVTQTLQGLGEGVEALHWRGEKTVLADFNAAFTDLQGRASEITNSEMQAFEAFVHSIIFPPTPNRNLDGSHLPTINGADPARGDFLFNNAMLAGTAECNACHTPPLGNRDTLISLQLVQGNQDMVSVHLRNQYEKTRFDNTPGGQTVRGFGFLHDGAFATHFDFFKDLSDGIGFDFFPNFGLDQDRLDVEAFMMAFPTGTHAATGVMVTMDGTNTAETQPIVQTLLGGSTGAIRLVAKGIDGNGNRRGWMRLTGGGWRSDRAAAPTITTTQLLALAAPGRELTMLATLVGDEVRLGVDRDEDGFFDRDELDAGTDPDDPASNPGAVSAPLAGTPGGRLWLASANPTGSAARFGFQLPQRGPVSLDVFDVTGRRVQNLVRSSSEVSGTFETVWDLTDEAGRRVAPGVYFVRLTTEGPAAGQRIVIMR